MSTCRRRLSSLLGEFGIEAHNADNRGWGGRTNGALVEAAVQAGFQCVLTRDRLFGKHRAQRSGTRVFFSIRERVPRCALFSESAAQTLKRFPVFCVVLVTIPQVRGAEFLQLFRGEWSRRPIQPAAGKLMRWPVD